MNSRAKRKIPIRVCISLPSSRSSISPQRFVIAHNQWIARQSPSQLKIVHVWLSLSIYFYVLERFARKHNDFSWASSGDFPRFRRCDCSVLGPEREWASERSGEVNGAHTRAWEPKQKFIRIDWICGCEHSKPNSVRPLLDRWRSSRTRFSVHSVSSQTANGKRNTHKTERNEIQRFTETDGARKISRVSR